MLRIKPEEMITNIILFKFPDEFKNIKAIQFQYAENTGYNHLARKAMGRSELIEENLNFCTVEQSPNIDWYWNKLDQSLNALDYTLAAVVLYRILEKQVTDLIDECFPFNDWALSPYRQIATQFIDHKQTLFSGFPAVLPHRPGFTDKLLSIRLLWPKSLSLKLVKSIIEQAEIRHKCWLIHGKSIICKDEYIAMQKVFMDASKCLALIGNECCEGNIAG